MKNLTWQIKILLITILMSLVGCGRDNGKPTAAQSIDPRLASIVQRYLDAAPDRGHLDDVTSIGFGEPTHKTADGQCFEGLTRQIVIREPRDGEIDAYVQAVVLHELGHCVHGLPHSKVSGSLMYDSFVFYDAAYWQKNLDIKLAEAFK